MFKKASIVILSVLVIFIASWMQVGQVTATAVNDGEPPRPTVEPTITPHPSSSTKGAVIKLIQPDLDASGELWTVVQWQGEGEWINVEGWRGTFSPNGEVSWWVSPSDLGKGPFRWLIYQEDEVLGTSESFYLPQTNGESIAISIIDANTNNVLETSSKHPSQVYDVANISLSDIYQTSGANGFIILKQQENTAFPANMWTQVQWMHPDGSWHNVDGWGGHFDDSAKVVWWVAPENAQTGPFRWIVYDNNTDLNVLATSNMFNLPQNTENYQMDLVLP